MFRRTALILGLSIAGLTGAGMAVHAATPSAAQTAHVTVQHTHDADSTDTDAAAACSTNAATGEQTGDCTDSQTTSGAQDTSGAGDAPETSSESNR